jgi:hypothetical protein
VKTSSAVKSRLPNPWMNISRRSKVLSQVSRAATARPPRGHLQGDLLERRIQGGLGKSAGLRSDNSRAAERLLLARSA